MLCSPNYFLLEISEQNFNTWKAPSTPFYIPHLEIRLCLVKLSMTTIFQIVLIAFWWVCVLIGSYLLYQLILYMKNKAPGHQSLLDSLYQDLFQKWIVSTFMVTIAISMWELEIKSWTASMIFGWPSFAFIVRGHIHLMLCGIVKFGLTFHPGKMEAIPERLTKQYIW